jgi:hypothetical protein
MRARAVSSCNIRGSYALLLTAAALSSQLSADARAPRFSAAGGGIMPPIDGLDRASVS